MASSLSAPIARSFFSLAISHHINASIEFNKEINNPRLGNEIKSSSICLRKAFKYSGIELKEDEIFTLEHAELLGIDLEKGFKHDKEDIQETLSELARLIKRGRMILYPAESEDGFMLSYAQAI